MIDDIYLVGFETGTWASLFNVNLMRSLGVKEFIICGNFNIPDAFSPR